MSQAPDPDSETGDEPTPASDRDGRFDRLATMVERIVPPLLDELMHPRQPAETIVFGGLHCAECAEARDTLYEARGELEDHLETTHDLWPSSLQTRIDIVSAHIADLSRGLRLIDEEGSRTRPLSAKG